MPFPDPAGAGRVGGLTKAANRAVERLLAARAEQGLPPTVVDPSVLAAVAAVLAGTKNAAASSSAASREETGVLSTDQLQPTG